MSPPGHALGRIAGLDEMQTRLMLRRSGFMPCARGAMRTLERALPDLDVKRTYHGCVDNPM